MDRVPSSLTFQIFVVAEYEGEMFVITPVLTQQGEMVIPLSGWVHVEDVVSADEEE